MLRLCSASSNHKDATSGHLRCDLGGWSGSQTVRHASRKCFYIWKSRRLTDINKNGRPDKLFSAFTFERDFQLGRSRSADIKSRRWRPSKRHGHRGEQFKFYRYIYNFGVGVCGANKNDNSDNIIKTKQPNH